MRTRLPHGTLNRSGEPERAAVRRSRTVSFRVRQDKPGLERMVVEHRNFEM